MKVKSIIRTGVSYYPGYLHQRFGSHCAQLSTTTTLKLRMAIQDVSRFRRGNVPYDMAELCKKMATAPQGVTDRDFILGYESDEGWQTGSIDYDRALQVYASRYPDDWEVVQKAVGLGRSTGRHASGYVISDQVVSDYIPLISVKGEQVTAFTAPSAEAVGAIKFDLLVVNALQDMQDTIQSIQSRHNELEYKEQQINGRRVSAHRLVPLPGGGLADIWDLPEEQGIFQDIVKRKTETVPQFGSPGSQKWLVQTDYRKANGNYLIDSIHEMAVFNALNRPGALDYEVQDPSDPDKKHNILVEYYRRARGLPGSQSIPAAVTELLPETFGLCIMQEQLQRVYQNMTGCSGSEAEAFRSDAAKKNKNKIEAAYANFMTKATERFGEKTAQAVWDNLIAFSRYSFNYSHSIAYSVVGYACLWLKHHYPLEWWTSVFRNATKNEANDKFWQYAGHLIDLPDVKLSGKYFEIQNERIRAPISLLHGIGEKTHLQLCQYAPYESLNDFAAKIWKHQKDNAKMVKKTKTNKKTGLVTESMVESLGRSAITRKTVHTLIISGAMDSLLPDDCSIGRAMSLFDEAMSEATGKKAKPIKEVYDNLDAIARIQTRKEVLPAYGTDLRPYFNKQMLPDNIKRQDNQMRYLSRQFDYYAKRTIDCDDPIIGIKRYKELSDSTTLPKGGWRVGVIAYLEDTRPFSYVDKKTKQNKSAIGLLFEVGGAKIESVLWPDDNGKLPMDAYRLKPGMIISLLMKKYSPIKDFSIIEFTILRNPLEKTKEEPKINETTSDNNDGN